MDKEIKTVKGYLSAVRKLEKNTIACLKGFGKLNDEQKQTLFDLAGEMGNLLGDFEEEGKNSPTKTSTENGE